MSIESPGDQRGSIKMQSSEIKGDPKRASKIPPISNYLPPGTTDSHKKLFSPKKDAISTKAGRTYSRRSSQDSGIDVKPVEIEKHLLHKVSSKTFEKMEKIKAGQEKRFPGMHFPSHVQKKIPPQQVFLIEAQKSSATKDQMVACAVSDGDGQGSIDYCFRQDIVFDAHKEATLYFVAEDPSLEKRFPAKILENLEGKTGDRQITRAIDKALDELGVKSGFSCILELRPTPQTREVYAISRGSGRRIILKNTKNEIQQLNQATSITKCTPNREDCIVLLSESFSYMATSDEVGKQIKRGDFAENIAHKLLTQAYQSGLKSRGFVMVLEGRHVDYSSIHDLSVATQAAYKGAMKSLRAGLATLFHNQKVINKLKADEIIALCHQRMNLGVMQDKEIEQQVNYLLSFAGILKGGLLPQMQAYFHEESVDSFDKKTLAELQQSLTSDEKKEFQQLLDNGQSVSDSYKSALSKDKLLLLDTFERMQRIKDIAHRVEHAHGPLENQIANILHGEKDAIRKSMLSIAEKNQRYSLLKEIEKHPTKILQSPYSVQFEPCDKNLF